MIALTVAKEIQITEVAIIIHSKIQVPNVTPTWNLTVCLRSESDPNSELNLRPQKKMGLSFTSLMKGILTSLLYS